MMAEPAPRARAMPAELLQMLSFDKHNCTGAARDDAADEKRKSLTAAPVCGIMRIATAARHKRFAAGLFVPVSDAGSGSTQGTAHSVARI